MKISHKEFAAIFKGKDKYEKMKENVRNVTEKLEEKTKNMRLNSVNSKKKRFVNMWLVKKYLTFISSKKIKKKT